MPNKFLAVIILLLISFSVEAQHRTIVKRAHIDSLYITIAKQDSIFFDTYNTCKLDAYMEFFADTFEFYHDKGGLMTSHKEMRESVQKYICNKVQRELKKGSIEVSPVPGFGAVEIGMHRFHNLVEKSISRWARFVIIWKQEGDKWKISKVISLH